MLVRCDEVGPRIKVDCDRYLVVRKFGSAAEF
jgi:hypothetical protein